MVPKNFSACFHNTKNQNVIKKAQYYGSSLEHGIQNIKVVFCSHLVEMILSSTILSALQMSSVRRQTCIGTINSQKALGQLGQQHAIRQSMGCLKVGCSLLGFGNLDYYYLLLQSSIFD